MMADLYLVSIGMDPFTWGSTTLDVEGSVRQQYIAALIKASVSEDYVDLVRFARDEAV